MQTKRFGLCAALSAAALLLLAGCAGSGSTAAPTLTVESSYPLQYAKQFTVDECTGGYELITIADSQYLVVPQGAAVPEDLPQGTTVLQQPIENIYLVSTSAMDPIISLGALDSIALSGTKADGWYLPEAKAAMQAGQIAYAGKYSAPDDETILASGCGLAIENTMIYHTPEVKEQLEKFGISVLVSVPAMKPTLWPAWNGSSRTAFCWANSRRRNSCLIPRYSALPRWKTSSPPAKRWRFSPSLPTTLSRCAKAVTMWPA